MDIALEKYRARLLRTAVLCLLAAASTAHAADYASRNYDPANTTDAGHARSTRPAAPPTPRASVPAARSGLPKRGQTMAVVRARRGAPRSIRGPVGQPPITRWNYPGYHVYFEDNRVIHTVVPKNPEPLHHVDQLRAERP